MLKFARNLNMTVKAKFYYLLVCLMACKSAYALDETDLTQDLSGGKDLQDVGNNANKFLSWGTTLFFAGCTVVGIVIVAGSLLKMKKASEEGSRESAAGPIIGFIIGGILTAVGPVAWMVRSTFISK